MCANMYEIQKLQNYYLLKYIVSSAVNCVHIDFGTNFLVFEKKNSLFYKDVKNLFVLHLSILLKTYYTFTCHVKVHAMIDVENSMS